MNISGEIKHDVNKLCESAVVLSTASSVPDKFAAVFGQAPIAVLLEVDGLCVESK